jgi:hypothetical protein
MRRETATAAGLPPSLVFGGLSPEEARRFGRAARRGRWQAIALLLATMLFPLGLTLGASADSGSKARFRSTPQAKGRSCFPRRSGGDRLLQEMLRRQSHRRAQ